ncbi:sphingolipid homeostasis protein orm1 [Entomophthora muscae]|uniref:Sphingolipid homeostasis protein orm1 n=1 Tax=Entomophthora muscae TaxID=34485 RepID=A0ACC2TYQ1_9FUNG|nr:sphingolipid homeostasis protein orm1 [Entomophthora muscae]
MTLVDVQKNPPLTQFLDATCQVNWNSSWTNYRGAWSANLILIVILKILFSSIPSISKELSWTLTNLTYNLVTFWVFHMMTGVPYQFNQGACDHLTLWEQIDNEAQYTATKKFLTSVPIILFLVSAHFSRYDLSLFTVNILSLILSLIGKLPAMHKVRLFGINLIQVD